MTAKAMSAATRASMVICCLGVMRGKVNLYDRLAAYLSTPAVCSLTKNAETTIQLRCAAKVLVASKTPQVSAQSLIGCLITVAVFQVRHFDCNANEFVNMSRDFGDGKTRDLAVIALPSQYILGHASFVSSPPIGMTTQA
jgi:hypothetical protein